MPSSTAPGDANGAGWNSRGRNFYVPVNNSIPANPIELPFNISDPYMIKHENSNIISWVINVTIKEQDPIFRVILITRVNKGNEWVNIKKIHDASTKQEEHWLIEIEYSHHQLTEVELFRREWPSAYKEIKWNQNLIPFEQEADIFRGLTAGA